MMEEDADETDHASPIKGLLWLLGACLLGAGMAVGIEPLAHAIPWRWEQGLAQSITPEAETPNCHYNPRAKALLQVVVSRLYPVRPDDNRFSIDVQVVKNPAVNAFAGLGGKITVNSGLLKQAQSPEELAGVLAHEMEHVRHRHIMQGFLVHMVTVQGLQMIFSGSPSTDVTWANFFLNMGFSRKQEAEADAGGLERLQLAHVDNNGFKHFFERMEDASAATQFLSDHPSNESRLEMVDSFANRDARPIMSRADWLVLKGYCQ